MSIINKMLKDLDRRNAAPGRSAPPVSAHAGATRPVRVGSGLFWWIVSAALVAAIAWLGWVMWQLMPRPVVNELALRSSANVAVAPVIATNSVADSEGDTLPQNVVSMDASLPSRGIKLDMLRLATEITTPIPKRPAHIEALPRTMTATARVSGGAADQPKPDNVSAPARSSAMAGEGDAARIDKHVFVSPRERADFEYDQAISLINRGRLAEGMDGLRSILNSHGAHEAARKTLVALLLEQRRIEEAVSLLQRGVEVDPSNTATVMLLARIMVDRQDVAGALALLRKYVPAGGGGADYHAFVAALHQRLGRHDDAVEEYLLALRPSPQVGAWWLGLGISQEAAGRKMEAADAFRRARASGVLAPELVDYIDQRLKLLQ